MRRSWCVRPTTVRIRTQFSCTGQAPSTHEYPTAQAGGVPHSATNREASVGRRLAHFVDFELRYFNRWREHNPNLPALDCWKSGFTVKADSGFVGNEICWQKPELSLLYVPPCYAIPPPISLPSPPRSRTAMWELRIGRTGIRVGEMSSRAPRGRFATPAQPPLHDCSPYRGQHERRESVGAVPRSRSLSAAPCRPYSSNSQ